MDSTADFRGHGVVLWTLLRRPRRLARAKAQCRDCVQPNRAVGIECLSRISSTKAAAGAVAQRATRAGRWADRLGTSGDNRTDLLTDWLTEQHEKLLGERHFAFGDGLLGWLWRVGTLCQWEKRLASVGFIYGQLGRLR